MKKKNLIIATLVTVGIVGTVYVFLKVFKKVIKVCTTFVDEEPIGI